MRTAADHAVTFDRAFLGSKTGPSARLPECRDRRSSRLVRGHAECVRPLRLDGQNRALSGHRSKAYEGYAKRTIRRALAATRKHYAHKPTSSGRTRRVQTFRVEHGTSFRMMAATRSRLLLKLMHRFRYFLSAATCQSGYGAVCKTVYPGSIPGVASNKFNNLWDSRQEIFNRCQCFVSER
jgi:hypothetical protein